MTLVILMADGARPDTLFGAMDAGQLPTLARLRSEGSAHVITSVFPSVTGSAYTPFLLGIHPGRAGLPGIRWWDRTRSALSGPGGARSYVGFEALRADSDLTRDHRTLFESAKDPLGALTPIGRGLRRSQRLGIGALFGLRLGWTHFRGDLKSWLRLDDDVAIRATRRIRRERPDMAFLVHFGIDKVSHERGHGSPEVLDAMRIVDRTAERLRGDAERSGWAHELEIWVVSDHGHSPVSAHEDLAGLFASWGLGVIAHPWILTGGTDAAIMVSGNAMAHVYLELKRRTRPWWPELRSRWESIIDRLLTRDSVDLVLLPHGPDRCEIRARGRGAAIVERDAGGSYSYFAESGDPLGLVDALGPNANIEGLSVDDVHALTFGSDYPDSLVQIIALAGAPRSGEIIISAARDWDLRSRWEPVRHNSSHGALHREHMMVPLILSRAAAGSPRRTVDVFPSALIALGQSVPDGIDGSSFR